MKVTQEKIHHYWFIIGVLSATLWLTVSASYEDYPTECPKVDPMNYTVLLPHETDCEKYYACSNGRKILMLCALMDNEGNRLHFNPTLHVCDYPDHAGCTAHTTTTEKTTLPTEITTMTPPSTTTTHKPHSTTISSSAPSTTTTHKPHSTTISSSAPSTTTTHKPHSTTISSSAPSTTTTHKPHPTTISSSAPSTTTTSRPSSTTEKPTTTTEPPASTAESTTASNVVSTSNPPTTTTVSSTTEQPTSSAGTTTNEPSITTTGLPSASTVLSTVNPPTTTVITSTTGQSTTSTESSTSEPPSSTTEVSPAPTTTSPSNSTPDSTSSSTSELTTNSESTSSETIPLTTSNAIVTTTEEIESTTTSLSINLQCTQSTTGVYFPHESYVHLYYECNYGELIRRECDESLVFDVINQVCVWSLDKDDNEELTETPTTIDPSNSSDVINLCNSDNSKNQCGRYPHECDCNKFYVCINSNAVLRICPSNLNFNPILKECDLPENVECDGGNNGNDNNSTTPIPTECPPDNTGLAVHLAHETNCSLFYKCNWGEKVELPCRPGLHFNPKLQVCDWPCAAGCTAEGGDGTNTCHFPSNRNDEMPVDSRPLLRFGIFKNLASVDNYNDENLDD